MNWLSAYFCKEFLKNFDTTKPTEYFADHEGWTNVKLTNPMNETRYAFIKLPKTLSKNTECIFVFHGRREHRIDTVTTYDIFNNCNDDFLYIIPDYRGFGDSKLDFDKDKNNEDMLDFIEYIRTEYKVHTFRFVGHSLGGVIAAYFLEYLRKEKILSGSDDPNFKISRIVLLAPFTDTLSVTKENLFRRHMLRSLVTLPLEFVLPENINYDLRNTKLDEDLFVIFHGKQDTRIDISHSQYLSEKNKIPLIEVEGNHDEIFDNAQVYDYIHFN